MCEAKKKSDTGQTSTLNENSILKNLHPNQTLVNLSQKQGNKATSNIFERSKENIAHNLTRIHHNNKDND